MARAQVYFKVDIDFDRDEDPQRIAREIARQLQKLYGVRTVELSNLQTEDDA